MALRVRVSCCWLILSTSTWIALGEAVYYDRSNSSLTELPSDIPFNVTFLELELNDFRSIPTRAFSQYKALETLSLISCNLTAIADDAFDGCPIKALFLNSNNLASMRHLYCLDSIKTTLTELSLSYNPIYPSTDPDWSYVLSALGALTYLKLKKMANSGMKTWPDLSEVANTVATLVISKNSFGTSLTADCFQGMINLEDLRLSINKLERFPDFSLFPGSKNLKMLFLEKNLLTHISADNLANFTSLEILDVSKNLLSSFPIVTHSTLQKLDLRNNPLICDSSMAWMKQLQSSSLRLLLDAAPCVLPENLVGVAWDDITLTDLSSGTAAQSEGQDILFDGNNLTCISTNTSIRTFRRHVAVEMPGTSVVVNVALDNFRRFDLQLEFYISAQPATSCDLLLTKCDVVAEAVTLRVFECICPSGGCVSGMLWQPKGDTPSQICEILYT